MEKTQNAPTAETTNIAGEAIWPGKEAWKNEPGNRYTPEELRQMARHWKFKVVQPPVEIHHVK